MATTKERINVSISKSTRSALARLAKRDQVPEATKAAGLLELALEIEEDRALDAIASQRDKRGVKFVSHENAWR
ncbi:hypothetical protein A3E65_00420 [Candidatus Kaiserbacteria bacterium RIFCSPHIGHO2_12_FULL_56_13]|uniref:Antitoxin, RHH family protein n=2 Tax=Candidatus Kaiseribacteriota TaxID=1752734 RepID=A0A1F6E2F0_9BACT|nr:MAG: hypothetical protein A3C95_00530 [Candidatus Kaiserbacteria bacterium RIFCSPHIGHO2_02_FULL_56_30]OGG71870.1 MAG: hypothetical protein A3E65_00420 [Candidatus Kaiserbacteria bacterium RIFCSPHIGHO2_12_FULL_56_13]